MLLMLPTMLCRPVHLVQVMFTADQGANFYAKKKFRYWNTSEPTDSKIREFYVKNLALIIESKGSALGREIIPDLIRVTFKAFYLLCLAPNGPLRSRTWYTDLYLVAGLFKKTDELFRALLIEMKTGKVKCCTLFCIVSYKKNNLEKLDLKQIKICFVLCIIASYKQFNTTIACIKRISLLTHFNRTQLWMPQITAFWHETVPCTCFTYAGSVPRMNFWSSYRLPHRSVRKIEAYIICMRVRKPFTKLIIAFFLATLEETKSTSWSRKPFLPIVPCVNPMLGNMCLYGGVPLIKNMVISNKEGTFVFRLVESHWEAVSTVLN